MSPVILTSKPRHRPSPALPGLGQRLLRSLSRSPLPRYVPPMLCTLVAEWTQNGLLRQPRFEGLRIDKKAREVRREQPKETPAT